MVPGMNGEAGRVRPGPPPGETPNRVGSAAARRRVTRARWAPWVVSVAAAALLVLGPGLAPGYLLVRDMVFTPSPPLTGRLLGLGHETPRAVPSDLVAALASHVLPGDLVQKLVLLAVLVAAGVGAARLAPATAPAGSAAALAAMWNPVVGERLAMGQWAYLVGYAALPWVVRGVARAARGERGGALLVLGLAAGSLGGAAAWLLLTLGALGAAVGVAVALRDARVVIRRLAGWAGYAVALALPWAVPGLTRPGVGSDPAGFEVFAPRADTPLGVVGSILTGGGIWNAEVVPAGRDTLVGAVGAGLLLTWSVAGYVLTRRGPERDAFGTAAAYRPALVGVGVAGLLATLLGSLPGLLAPVAALPGGGLLRDGARSLGLWVLVLAVGAGWATAWLGRRSFPAVAAVLAVLLPAAVLPALGWGLAGTLHPTTYPTEVLDAASLLDAEAGDAAVVVLPFETYRRYAWNGSRPSLTPWSRLVARPVVAASDLVVARPDGLRTVAGEDGYAAAVGAALDGADPIGDLRRLGVGWLLADADPAGVPSGAVGVTQGREVSVYRLGDGTATADGGRWRPPTGVVVGGDVLAVLAVVAAGGLAARRRDTS